MKIWPAVRHMTGLDRTGVPLRGWAALELSLMWLVWGLALGMLCWASGFDVALQRALYASRCEWFDQIVRTVSSLGLGRTLIFVVFTAGCVMGLRTVRPGRRFLFLLRLLWGCVAQLGLWARGRFVWTAAWQLLCPMARGLLMIVPGLAVSGLLQLMLKASIGRPRPKMILWEGASPYALSPIWESGFNARYMSFPSGHSCSTWLVCTILMHVWPRWAGPIFAFGVVVSATRFLAVTPHYLGDVVAGAGVGGAVGLALVRLMGVGVSSEKQGAKQGAERGVGHED